MKVAFDLSYLSSFTRNTKLTFIAGCDEVGRGPLAGPVVGASVMLVMPTSRNRSDLNHFFSKLENLGITDSKKLNTKKRREILFNLGIDYQKIGIGEVIPITNYGPFFLISSVSEISPAKIDEINILQASLQVMRDSFSVCYNFLEKNYNSDECRCCQNSFLGKILIDGIYKIGFKKDHVDEIAIKKGDQKSFLIALASIIAKEYRDNLMSYLDKLYPQYSLSQNAGYPTKKHKEAISIYGPSEIHRKTFKGVKEYLL